MCVKRVRAALTKVADVKKVTVDFAKKTAHVTMKSGKSIDETAVKKALKGAGKYGLTSVKQAGASKDAKKKG